MSEIASLTNSLSVSDSCKLFNKQIGKQIAKEVLKEQAQRMAAMKDWVDPQVSLLWPNGLPLDTIVDMVVGGLGFNYIAKFYEEYIRALETLKGGLEEIIQLDTGHCAVLIPNKKNLKTYRKLEPAVKGPVCRDLLTRYINDIEICQQDPRKPGCTKLTATGSLQEIIDFRNELDENLSKVESLAKSIDSLKNATPMLEVFSLPGNFDKHAAAVAWKRMNLVPTTSTRGCVWSTAGFISGYLAGPTKWGGFCVAAKNGIKRMFRKKK